LPKKRPEEWIEIEPVVVGPESENKIFTVVEIDPEFPGGMEAMYKFFQDNIRYPKEAKRKNISGKVFITFVVEKDGSISNPRILRDIGGGCGAEAIRVAKMMPRWTPGQQRGLSVRVQFNMPVNFSLSK
jgi:protein TonB